MQFYYCSMSVCLATVLHKTLLSCAQLKSMKAQSACPEGGCLDSASEIDYFHCISSF